MERYTALADSDVLNTASARPVPRLTSLSHGGGCGCKIAPGVLSEILKGSTGMPMPPELLVGIETADDAAVYRLNDTQALIATTPPPEVALLEHTGRGRLLHIHHNVPGVLSQVNERLSAAAALCTERVQRMQMVAGWQIN